MADSATDVSVPGFEDVCVRFLKDGEVVDTFAGLKSCSNAKVPGKTEVVNSAMSVKIGKKKLLPWVLVVPLNG